MSENVVTVLPTEMSVEIGKQGQRMMRVIHAQNVGTTVLSGGIVTMPPGKVSDAHLHETSDLILIITRGYGATLYGAEMTPLLHDEGSWTFIRAGEPHAAVNLHPTEELVAYEFRTDPTFREDVVLLPELRDLAVRRGKELMEQARLQPL